MDTPIVDFVRNYADKKALRLHMPGHKGKSFLGCESADITEIEGADVLYSPNGIIKQSEDNAAQIFGTSKTVYSTEGSSLSIRAMLYLVKIYGNTKNKKAFIAAGRNAHKTFVTAAALLDYKIDWLTADSDETVISCNITPKLLTEYLSKAEQKPLAVYVTSPDYLGNMLDIKGLAEVCRKYGVLLLVDNAHGAYLRFLAENLHPIALGADMCCDSAHKTLPVLTGGAYLHIGKNAPETLKNQADTAMSLFASTSPSYLILQSLDMANKYMVDRYSDKLQQFALKVEQLKAELTEFGYSFYGSEPLKLTVLAKAYGYKGFELARLLSEKGIECEFSDNDFTVMMLSENIGNDGVELLKNSLLSIPKKEAITEAPPKPVKSRRILSLKEAVFSVTEELPVEKCCGRVLGTATVACPPAIPIVVCGEEITPEAIECFKYYSIKTCFVVADKN